MISRILLLVVLLSALFAPRLLMGDNCGPLACKEKSDVSYKVFPVDEGEKDDSFKTFRDELIQACRRKDLKFLLRHTDENISFSFGFPNTGTDDFIKVWKLDKEPGQSLIWGELEYILNLGGAFEKDGSFNAPYTFAGFPDFADGFESVVCVSSNVFLRASPSASGPVVKKLCYDILTFADDRNGKYDYWRVKGKAGWLKVRTRQGEEGYVLNKYVRSPIDYRASFSKKNGVWKMTDFVSGD
ncbi:MAG: SH3 domain-containing protein [Endomicrobiia bacterium]|nr:SH3 domain-containing protein [Endomicrobiia bacterium]